MNTFLYAAAAFAVLGVIALIMPGLVQQWQGGPRSPDDYGAVVLGVVLLGVCWIVALVCAAIGFALKLF